MTRLCDECGCETVQVDKSVTAANDKIAHDTWHKLRDAGILCVNIMGSPGAGKTTLIENLGLNMAVIQGDLESDIDKKRMKDAKIPVYQINTHSGCHLNAQMIADALVNFEFDNPFLLIENVGNLVCPTGVKLGQHVNVLVSSVTEGHDKPEKYPHIFRFADVIVISKYDLAEHVGFDEKTYLDSVKKANPNAWIFRCPGEYEKLGMFLERIDPQHKH